MNFCVDGRYFKLSSWWLSSSRKMNVRDHTNAAFQPWSRVSSFGEQHAILYFRPMCLASVSEQRNLHCPSGDQREQPVPVQLSKRLQRHQLRNRSGCVFRSVTENTYSVWQKARILGDFSTPRLCPPRVLMHCSINPSRCFRNTLLGSESRFIWICFCSVCTRRVALGLLRFFQIRAPVIRVKTAELALFAQTTEMVTFVNVAVGTADNSVRLVSPQIGMTGQENTGWRCCLSAWQKMGKVLDQT